MRIYSISRVIEATGRLEVDGKRNVGISQRLSFRIINVFSTVKLIAF